jgi:Chaperone of endosialidase
MSDFGDLLIQQMQQNIDAGAYNRTASLSNTTAANAADQNIINNMSNVKSVAAVPNTPTATSTNPMSSGTAQKAASGIGSILGGGSGGTAGGNAASGAIDSSAGDTIMSDQRLKTNIKKTMEEDINDFIKTLSPKSFDYKNEQDGSHTEAGMMAQELEKSKIGKSVVKDTPRGKAIDTAKLTPLITSIFGQKLQMLEQKINKSLDDKFKRKK